MIKSKYIFGLVAFFGALHGCSAAALGVIAWLIGIYKAAENTPTMHPFVYTLIYSMPMLCAVAIHLRGAWSWATPAWIFGVIPIAEHASTIFRAKCFDCGGPKRVSHADGPTRDHWLYDTVLYVSLPIHFFLLALFLSQAASIENTWDLVGLIISVGLCSGSLGINVAHELGHRRGVVDHFLAKCLLSSVLYSHWFVEHNRGHHLRVATLEDPATSRRGENVYAFWLRSITGGVRDAYRMRPKEVLLWQLVQILLMILIGVARGPKSVVIFVLTSLVAILLLETVNYIEHYGLLREKNEPVRPCHSWNSNNVISRMFLFELTHHSDHHANPKKTYARLETKDQAPQLPTGYAGMVLIALVPPLFFRLMRQNKN